MQYYQTPVGGVGVAGNQYIQTTPAPPPPNPLNTVGRKIEAAAKHTENFAGNVYNHYRTGPGLIDVTKSRLDHATRFLFEGSSDSIFHRDFGYVPGEKLKKALACYLSITGRPMMGTLYVSNRRVGFKSDSPVWSGPTNGPGSWVYYKVIMNVEQIQAVNQPMNRAYSSDRYINIVTKDGHEFWFMGFISYEKALKYLYEALPPAPLHNFPAPIHNFHQQQMY